MRCLKLEYLEFTEPRAEKNDMFARGNFGVDVVVAGLNHVAHQIGDPPTKRRQQQIVRKAKAHNGSTDWAFDVEKGRFGELTNKCNLFVDDVLGEVGVLKTSTGVLAKGLGIARVGVGLYDMYQNGVNISNSLDAAMSALALTPSGIGQGVAAGYFITNAGVSYFTGKDIGQHIQGWIQK